MHFWNAQRGKIAAMTRSRYHQPEGPSMANPKERVKGKVKMKKSLTAKHANYAKRETRTITENTRAQRKA